MSAPTALAVAKVLTMLNTWRACREIAALSGVTISRVRGYLEKLQEQGYLAHAPGVERSIVMTDRCANICDDEMERASHGGNGTIVKHPIGNALGAAIPLLPPSDDGGNTGGTDCIADFDELLGKLP